jgi:hypothetical protein
MDTRPIQHMEGEWFKSIQEFLHKTNSKIKISGVWTPQLQRKHDACIMDTLRDCHDTIRINRVRIYLQATTIADITNAEETYITEYSFGGRNSQTTENPRKSIHEWPRQPRPGPKAWRAWREALQLKLSVGGKSRRLRQPLGKWTTSQKNTRQEWNWYYDTKTENLIQRQGSRFGIHKAINAKQFEEIQSKLLPRLPQEAIPVTSTNYRITSIPIKSNYPTKEVNNETPNTFEEYVDQLNDWERNLL